MDDKKNDEWRLALCATPSAVLQRPSQASFAWPPSGADGVVVSAKSSAHIGRQVGMGPKEIRGSLSMFSEVVHLSSRSP